MAYGGVEATRSVKGSIMYYEGPNAHSDEHVQVRNLKMWTSDFGDDSLSVYENMQIILDRNPNDRRKNESYNFLVSYGRDEFDVDKPEEVEAMAEHVRKTCDRQFGNNVPYAVYIQGDGAGGKLHAHIVALNVDLETGKSIRGSTSMNKWRYNMNEVTREQEALNKTLDFPEKNARVIHSNVSARKKQIERHEWRNELMDVIDKRLVNTTAVNFDSFVEELEEDGIEMIFETKGGKRTLLYRYSPDGGVESNGVTKNVRRSKSSNLGTSYMVEGVEQRFEDRQQELLSCKIKQVDSIVFDFDDTYTPTFKNSPVSAPAFNKTNFDYDLSVSETYKKEPLKEELKQEVQVQKQVQKNVQKPKVLKERVLTAKEQERADALFILKSMDDNSRNALNNSRVKTENSPASSTLSPYN